MESPFKEASASHRYYCLPSPSSGQARQMGVGEASQLSARQVFLTFLGGEQEEVWLIVFCFVEM